MGGLPEWCDLFLHTRKDLPAKLSDLSDFLDHLICFRVPCSETERFFARGGRQQIYLNFIFGLFDHTKPLAELCDFFLHTKRRSSNSCVCGGGLLKSVGTFF